MTTQLRTPVQLAGAGRTDAGVHARQLFAHFDIDMPIDTEVQVPRLNAFLPGDIAIQRIFEVNSNAHARFDALERTYQYWVIQQKDPFFRDWAYHVRLPLDVKAMNKAASLLLDHTNFECFSKSNTDVKTYVCHLKSAAWKEEKGKLVFTITADRFLRNMVRAIVGTLLEVGLGKATAENVNSIIKSKDRGEAGVSVPAKGLYLTKITYPKTLIDLNG